MITDISSKRRTVTDVSNNDRDEDFDMGSVYTED